MILMRDNLSKNHLKILRSYVIIVGDLNVYIFVVGIVVEVFTKNVGINNQTMTFSVLLYSIFLKSYYLSKIGKIKLILMSYVKAVNHRIICLIVEYA